MIVKWQDTPWVRRIAFVGLNFAACLVVFILIAQPISELLAERDAEIATMSEALGRMNAIANRKSDVDAMARRIDAESDLGEFLAAANEGAANAGLQARLKTMVESGGARIRSIQGLPSKSNGQISYIGARIDLYGTLAAIHKTVYTVESGKPYLFVSSASIRIPQSASARTAATEPVIDAQLDVFGAMPMETLIR